MDGLEAVILAGGRSTRFGSDKASALLGGRPLLQWVIDAASGACGRIVVVAATGQTLPDVSAAVPVIVVRDHWEALGPVAGLATGLEAVQGPVAFVASCDAPLLRPEVIRLLVARIGDADAACPVVGGQRQPLVAAYRASTVRRRLAAAAEAGELKLVLALQDLRLVEVPETAVRAVDPELDSFRNLNTPERLEETERALRERR